MQDGLSCMTRFSMSSVIIKNPSLKSYTAHVSDYLVSLKLFLHHELDSAGTNDFNLAIVSAKGDHVVDLFNRKFIILRSLPQHHFFGQSQALRLETSKKQLSGDK